MRDLESLVSVSNKISEETKQAIKLLSKKDDVIEELREEIKRLEAIIDHKRQMEIYNEVAKKRPGALKDMVD